MNYVKRLYILLFFTALLTMFACVLVAIQQTQIHNLQQTVHLRETSWDKQVKFDEAVTERLNK